MVTDAEYEEAGLYDPAVDAGTGRIELLRWLTSRGFTIEEMIEGVRTETLGALAGDKRLVPGERLTNDAGRALSGLSPERFDMVATAFGFTPLDDQDHVGSSVGELALTKAEVEAVARFGELTGMFSDDEGLGFIRVVGNSITRIAEAAVSMFLTDVESPHVQDAGSELELSHKVLAAIELLDEFIPLLDPVMRRQIMQSIDRGRRAMVDQSQRLEYRYAVGFVDLVGFTPISQDMPAPELADFIRRFEGRAHDAVTAVGARLVKLIGDEVMFVAPSADAACKVSQVLMSSLWAEGAGDVEPRGGIAYGDVLVRGGDYYGQIVNLASRLATAAQPKELLVSSAFAEASSVLPFASAGRRALKGFSELVEVSSHTFD